MKATIQVYTAKGFYGPVVERKVYNVAEVGAAVLDTLDKMADELEGERLMDWTRITVEVERK